MIKSAAVDDVAFAIYEDTARAWLADWGSYWYHWRDRDELGYPRVNILHPSHGVSSGRGDIPDMPNRVAFVDRVVRMWSAKRRSIAWIVWVDEAGESQGWQRSCLRNRYDIQIGRGGFSEEILCIVAAIAGMIVSAESIDFAGQKMIENSYPDVCCVNVKAGR